MTRSFKSLPPVFGSLVLVLITPCLLHGHDDSITGKQGWTLKTFHVLDQALGDEAAGKLPPANADDAAWDKAIAESTQLWKRVMYPQGLDLGSESKLLYDADTETMSIYATPAQVSLLESYTEVLCGCAPRHMTITLEVLEGPSSLVRELTAKAQPLQSHATMLREFEALASRNEAKHLATLRLETRSGQRSIVQSGPEQSSPSTFVRHEPGAIATLGEIRSAGVKLEVDPIIGPDGWMMDLSYALQVHNAPPKRREAVSPPLGDSQMHKLPVFDFSLARITSAITYNGDDTKLLGVWTPCQANGQPRSEMLQAAFLRMVPVSSGRGPNPLVEMKLREHLHRQRRIQPVGAKPELAVPAGKGLMRREFKVPRSFLFNVSSGNNVEQQRGLFLHEDGGDFCFTPKSEQPVSADPFARQDATTGRMVTFPEGTDVHYHPEWNVLEVVHTEEGLRKIDRFLDLVWSKTPTLLAFSLHIVEADGPTLRQMAKDSATYADHTSLWAKLEELARAGKATVLSTQRMETRTGQRSSFIVGQEYATVGAFQRNVKGRIEAKTSAKVIGTSWEIDPVLSPDLRSIDVNLSLEYHFAPLQPSPSGATPTPDVGLETEKTYAAKVLSAYSLQSGTTRLISLWKPSGTPELDAEDVLQAAFLRADVVPVVNRENP